MLAGTWSVSASFVAQMGNNWRMGSAKKNIAVEYARAGHSRRSPVLEIWPNDGAGCILFYPGTMTSPGHYHVLLAALHDAGFTVAALHLSGHGLKIKERRFTFLSLVNEGLEAENWLLARGCGKVAICGHSQGGILALAHAASSGDSAAAFALGAVFPQLEDAALITRFGWAARQRETLMRPLRRLAGCIPALPVPLPFYLSLSRILAGRKRPLYVGKGNGRASYPLEFVTSLFDARMNTSFQCPVWLFSAVNDRLFTRKIIEETFACIRAPSKKMIWLGDGGHLAVMNPQISEFIARSMAAACAGLGFYLKLDI